MQGSDDAGLARSSGGEVAATKLPLPLGEASSRGEGCLVASAQPLRAQSRDLSQRDGCAPSDGWLDLGPGWLFTSIRDAVVVADAESGRIALWNPAATQLLGFAPADVLGVPLPELVADLEQTPRWRAVRTGESNEASAQSVELFARRKSAADVCVELTLSRLESTADTRSFVLAVIRDISERRQAEEERIERIREHVAREESATAQRRLEVLAEASRLLDASLDYEATLQEVARVAAQTLADWCVVHLLEQDGSIRWLAVAHGDPAKEALARELQERYPATEGVARVLRTGASEVYGNEGRSDGEGGDAGDGDRVDGDSGPRAVGGDRERGAGSHGEAVGDGSEDGGARKVGGDGGHRSDGRHRGKRRHGDPSELQRIARARDADHLRMLRELDSRAVMIVPLTARGRMLGALSLISTRPGRTYDATDLAIAEELARRCGQAVDNARLHLEAQTAVKARDRFVSIASHELRTPIARVKGYAEMVLAAYADGDLNDELLQRSLRRIDHASDRLAALVRDLLDVSKISAGNLPLRLRAVDLTDLVREVVGRYQEQLSGSGHLLLDIVGTPGRVTADPDRIEQVLTNLLDNAVKYSPDGAELRVRLQPKARGVLLEVQDHGIGLPPEAAERIFEPFSRASNAEGRQITGMGLGLYICRNIVEQHHGRIWARSAGEGSGTLMSVWLPEPTAAHAAAAA